MKMIARKKKLKLPLAATAFLQRDKVIKTDLRRKMHDHMVGKV